MATQDNTLNHKSQDTICAISTPPGMGGIAVIRISGTEALQILSKIWKGKDPAHWQTHTVHLGQLSEGSNVIDQAVATYFAEDKSYTGQTTVELSVHGSPLVQTMAIDALCSNGARLAEPGEFTRRALQNGRMDLVQAEAVADLLSAQSRAAHRIAMNQMRGNISTAINDLRQQLTDLAALLELELDFAEEDVEFADRHRLVTLAQTICRNVRQLHDTYQTGMAIRNGIPVAIAGPTNAGKSSLFNALVQDDRAIVSDIHGTTRDIIEDTITIGEHLFRIKDTAGLRQTQDAVEQLGIQRSHRAISQAAVIMAIADASAETPATIMRSIADALEKQTADSLIMALNKSDKTEPSKIQTLKNLLQEKYQQAHIIATSAKTGQGIDEIKNTLQEIASSRYATDAGTLMLTNSRQADQLRTAAGHAAQVCATIADGLPADLVAQHLRATIGALASLTGNITDQTILSTIFSRFCIGK